VDGRFDVGDHELYLTCAGTGSPTVVFMDGLGGGSTIQVMTGLARGLTSRHQVCAYDRVNTGLSDRQETMHTGADSVRDLKALLAVADVRGPYLLLGWSWGGLLASMYAGTHPDEVMGLVLLDPALPTDDDLEEANIPADELARLKTEWNAVEKDDLYRTLDQAKQLVPSIPDVPVTYLAADSAEVPPTERDKKMKALRQVTMQQFVDQLKKGRLVTVKSSHDIAQDQPDLVVDEVQRILANA
jgi:pimeloyl-ACP methyl ester carboxylesterase